MYGVNSGRLFKSEAVPAGSYSISVGTDKEVNISAQALSREVVSFGSVIPVVDS